MHVSRRALIVGGVAAGVVVAWAAWPEGEAAGLPLADGETAFAGWIKIGSDGHIVVAVPQLERGQGAYTALAQVAADELGADWRTVGIEAAPIAARYANPLAAETLFGAPAGLASVLPDTVPMLTAGSTSIRSFEGAVRRAAAVTRALLCKAAARRWGGDWTACSTDAGFVVLGDRRARFGELAADAARETVPDTAGPRVGGERLAGLPLPRLDAPSKVDGSANFAGDVRLPGMVFASIRQAPPGAGFAGVDRGAADAVPGMISVVENPGWIAAIGQTWWAANRGLAALAPKVRGPSGADDASIARALAAALGAEGTRVAGEGEVAGVLAGPGLTAADYRIQPGVHAPLETMAATAAWADGKLTLWLGTGAPGLARDAAARAAGIAAGDVVLHPLMAGGGFGAELEVRAAEQAAVLAVALGKPVGLVWSLAESLTQTPVRPPALVRMTARAGAGGAVLGWRASVSAPDTAAGLHARLRGVGGARGATAAVAADGAAPPYRFAAWAVDHHAADIGVPTGWFPGGAALATVFARESFLDELARNAGAEPLSYRIGMLGGAPRLARCLSTVAALGGWQGGGAGSGQGIAAHAMRGSYIALMVEGGMADGARPRVERMVAAVDVGRAINPDLVRQVVEGALIVGLAAATGTATGFARGLPDVRGIRDLLLPRLGTSPDITVELIESREEPGGASELGVPVVAPALSNAIHAATGRRLRSLPL